MPEGGDKCEMMEDAKEREGGQITKKSVSASFLNSSNDMYKSIQRQDDDDEVDEEKKDEFFR